MKNITFRFLAILGLIISPFIGFTQNTVPSTHQVPVEQIEVFLAKLKAQHIFNQVQKLTGADRKELKMFSQFYQDSIAVRDRSAFRSSVLMGRITTDADVKAYADKKIPEYVAMYNRFEALRKSAPSTIEDYMMKHMPPIACIAGCNNLDFENGSLSNWTACYSSNVSTSSSLANTGFTCFGPLGAVTTAAYDPSTSSNQVSLTSGAGFDPIAGALIPVVAPGGGSFSCMVGDNIGINAGIARIEQTFMVTAGQPNLTYMYAVLLENPQHTFFEQPYFQIELLDQFGNPIPGCGQYSVVSGPGLPGYTSIYYPTNADTVYAKPWTTEFIPLSSYIGTCVTLIVTAADCSAGAHFGYGYFDALCTPQAVITSSPAICGANNVTLTAPGGAAAYTWLGPCITGPNNQQSTTVNCAGTYSVVLISDMKNPCPDTLKITVTVSPALNFNQVSTVNVKCNGGNTGSETVLATGGTAPFTYSWNPANGTNATATGLSAGSYTAYVTDNAGCKDSILFTITQPPALTAPTTSTNATCATLGSATVMAGGGTPGYTYVWNPSGNTNATATGLSAGTYTVTVKDANGCTQTNTAIVTNTGALNVTTAVTNVLCNGGTGSILATVTGGTTPYTYAWTPIGGTNANATGLTIGTYTISVTDANGCTGSATATITQPPALTATATATSTVCGGNTGTATVTAVGGTPTYTYSWAPGGQTNATATGLSVGIYTVTVTDKNGCTATASANVISISTLTANITASTNILCNGGATGSATVTAAGGTPAYTYAWAPSGQTNATATGLTAGSYNVTVTDNNGCSIVATVTLTQPPLLTATMGAPTNLKCNGDANGSATVTAAGGTPAYTYAWTPTGGATATGTGLTAGNYTVTVTDNNGCTATATITITQPTAITATTTIVQSVCGNPNGSATVTAGGGTPAYTYAWAPGGQTNATATGLTVGIYTITVTDNNGCTQTATANVTSTPPLTVTTTTTGVLCNGGSTGTATSTVVGGTAPFTYAWTPTGGTNATATGLSIGTYTITVNDINGCSGTATATITQPAALTATATATQTTCAGNTGTTTVTAAGGTPAYTYSWAPGGQTNATATGLSAGIYTITVTDNNGCTQTASASVTTIGGETVSITASTNITCNGANDGTATANVVGGTGPYTYAWTPAGGTTANATGLSAGIYTITVTDNNGCIAFTTVTITEPPVLTAAITSTTNIVCNGVNIGSLTVTAGGGTPNYTYAWAPAGGAAPTANGLSAGTYTVTVTDANGCTATATGTITQPTLLTANISATVNITCFGLNNGSLAVAAAGGTPAYTYAWAPSGGTSAIASGLSAGSYTVNVTDANGCTATTTGTITQPAVLTAAMTNTGNITCFGSNNGTLTVTPAGGTTVYTYAWAPSGGNTATASNLSAGTYTVNITDANGCTTTASGTITEPTPLTVTASGPGTICPNSKALLSSIPAGGTGPYTYSWSSGGSTGTTSVIVPSTSTYTISITDNNGCTASATVLVNTSPPLTAAVTGATSFCPGGTATLTVNASGGNGNYTYLWQPGSNSSQSISVSPTSTTTYNVTVMDACGNNVVIPVTVTINPVPTVSFLADPQNGCAPLCVQFRDLTSIPGGKISQWKWNFGNGDSTSGRNPIYCYKDTGVYNVTLTATSDSGCSSTLDVLKMITVYPHPNANFTYSPQPVVIDNPLVQFVDNSTSRYPLVYWNWVFGDPSSAANNTSELRNPSHQYSDTGTYCATLIVIDQHGCVDSITNCFIVNPLFTLYIPDAFSPNADGINDVFMAKGSYIKDFEMYIFDRWGMQLFHAKDIMDGWDGKVNHGSVISQEDTYVYLIYVTDTQGNKHSYNGMVNLIK